MKINILNIKNTYGDQCELEEKIDLSADNNDEYTFSEPCEAKYKIRIIGNTVLFKCEFRANMTFVCNKCLEEYKDAVSGEFQALYLSPKDYKMMEAADAGESIYSENDVSREKLENDTIDTYPILRENVIVSIPYVNKCSPDCKGIEIDIK